MVVPPEFLKSLTKRLGVSEGELQVLLDTLEGEDLSAIAQKLGVQRNALQKRLGEVYKKFRIEGSGPGKFAKLQKIILEEYQKQVNQQKTPEKTIDLRDAPVVGTFFDRTEELTQGTTYLIKERYPIVAICGMGGMGKSVFAVRLVEQIADDYDYIFWRNLSLRSLPTLDNLIHDLISFFNPQDTEKEGNHLSSSADLIEHFRRDRCLVILDNYESLFQSQTFAGYYQPNYESYGELIKQIAQTRHQSNLLIISRETPLELMSLVGDKLQNPMIILKGLTQNGINQLLTQKGINPDETTLNQLMKHSSGHPVALNQLAFTVQTLFDGNLPDLLKQDTIFISEIMSNYLSKQLDHLSALEREIIEQLAVVSEGLTLTEIQNTLSQVNNLSEVMTALSSLNRRYLLEKVTHGTSTRFTIIPILKQYVN